MNHSIQNRFDAPWQPVADQEAQLLVAELQRELPSHHKLFSQPAEAVARRSDCDDVLFRFGNSLERYAVVLMTWTGKKQLSSKWPKTDIFDSFEQFAADQMKAM